MASRTEKNSNDNFLSSQNPMPTVCHQDKSNSLLALCEALASYSSDNPGHIPDNLYRDTLILVLGREHSELPQENKTCLTVALQNAVTNLFHMINLVKDPWTNPTLSKVLLGYPVNDSEALAFCLKETPTVLTIRLEVLCKQKNENLALQLVAFCRKWLSDALFLEACSSAQREFWLDLHITLLYRQEASRTEIPMLLEMYSLEDGYKLVKRLITKKTSNSQSVYGTNHIWQNCLQTAEFITRCLLTTAFMQCQPPDCLPKLAVQLVRLQKSPKVAKDVLFKMANENKLGKSSHMYILCETFLDKFQDELKPLCIELYIRAVTLDRDDLDILKLSADRDTVARAKMSLDTKVSRLTELISTNARISTEITLTLAASLRLNKERSIATVSLEQSAATCSMGNPILIPSADHIQETEAVKEHNRSTDHIASGSDNGPIGCSILTTSVEEALQVNVEESAASKHMANTSQEEKRTFLNSTDVAVPESNRTTVRKKVSPSPSRISPSLSNNGTQNKKKESPSPATVSPSLMKTNNGTMVREAFPSSGIYDNESRSFRQDSSSAGLEPCSTARTPRSPVGQSPAKLSNNTIVQQQLFPCTSSSRPHVADNFTHILSNPNTSPQVIPKIISGHLPGPSRTSLKKPKRKNAIRSGIKRENAVNNRTQEQQQPKEQVNKTATPSTKEDVSPCTSTNPMEITAGSSGADSEFVRNYSSLNPVTLVSTPGVDNTEEISQPGATSNKQGHSTGTFSTATDQTFQSTASPSSRSQLSREEPNMPSSASDDSMVSFTTARSSPYPTNISSPCRMRLIESSYLDTSVSSPPRSGVQSHDGDNSNSSDPQRSSLATGEKPSSSVMHSPQAARCRPFRKQHHHCQQKNGDLLASLSHPSQSSTPFSPPSSGSQDFEDTCPSPSEMLGGFVSPKGFVGSGGDSETVSTHPKTSFFCGASRSASLLFNFDGTSPTLSNQQPFTLKEPINILTQFEQDNLVMQSSSSSPAGVTTPFLSQSQDLNGQTGLAINTNSSDEGLGLELGFPLDSSLNRFTNQSLTRDVPETQQLITENHDMCLSDSAHSNSPLLGVEMSFQFESETTGSNEDSNFNERLREFDSVLERDTASPCGNNLENEPEMDHSDVGSDEESAVPPSLLTLSELMGGSKTSPKSPNSTEGAMPSHPDSNSEGNSSEDDDGPPFIELVTVASASEEEDEEIGNKNSVQFPDVKIKEEPQEPQEDNSVPHLLFPASYYVRGVPPRYRNLNLPKARRVRGRTHTNMRAHPAQESHVTNSSDISNTDKLVPKSSSGETGTTPPSTTAPEKTVTCPSAPVLIVPKTEATSFDPTPSTSSRSVPTTNGVGLSGSLGIVTNVPMTTVSASVSRASTFVTPTRRLNVYIPQSLVNTASAVDEADKTSRSQNSSPVGRSTEEDPIDVEISRDGGVPLSDSSKRSSSVFREERDQMKERGPVVVRNDLRPSSTRSSTKLALRSIRFLSTGYPLPYQFGSRPSTSLQPGNQAVEMAELTETESQRVAFSSSATNQSNVKVKKESIEDMSTNASVQNSEPRKRRKCKQSQHPSAEHTSPAKKVNTAQACEATSSVPTAGPSLSSSRTNTRKKYVAARNK